MSGIPPIDEEATEAAMKASQAIDDAVQGLKDAAESVRRTIRENMPEQFTEAKYAYCKAMGNLEFAITGGKAYYGDQPEGEQRKPHYDPATIDWSNARFE